MVGYCACVYVEIEKGVRKLHTSFHEEVGVGLVLRRVVLGKEDETALSLLVNGDAGEPGGSIEEGNAEQDEDDHGNHILLDVFLDSCSYLAFGRNQNLGLGAVFLRLFFVEEFKSSFFVSKNAA